MSERQKVYRAHVNFDHRGATVWCHYGYVSECGAWIDGGDTRWRRTPDWFDTEAEAKASLADEVAAMAAKILHQASELRAAKGVAA
ncbi:MAG: hypothetical protein EBR82_30190 [Caulobacteraceae bacterium]|nr:hypothetical protein [Caulobacteraceae bacterium]